MVILIEIASLAFAGFTFMKNGEQVCFAHRATKSYDYSKILFIIFRKEGSS